MSADIELADICLEWFKVQMTIEGWLIAGLIVGLLVGISVPMQRFGCFLLLIVPIAMIGYISWWQGANPESLRSTSALDFLFGPLWPSIGALVGYYAGKTLHWYFRKR